MSAAALLAAVAALASTDLPAAASDETAAPQRPSPMFNRWQEDWSVLADPSTPREPLDGLKYIPFGDGGRTDWVTLGAQVRERYESNHSPGFAVTPGQGDAYLISRLEAYADAHAGPVQAFVELQSDYATGKRNLAPVDADQLDLEQAFVTLVEPVGDGTLKVRFGRQQFAFDLQRFVSARDGPNVRQSYDAAWADYERGAWRFIAFYSQPVQNRNLNVFDDYSSGRLTYSGVRVERKLPLLGDLSVYYSRFTQDNASFPSIKGNERRDIADARLAGAADGFDWDLEAMGQGGRIGPDDVAAWAVGSRGGYTWRHVGWTPRLGLQLDAASGDSDPRDHTLGTFNPLFPNGYYVTLSGYTGYVNFIHLKPSVTVAPTDRLTLMLAAAAQWRETTADAVYTQPDIPVPRTAGRGHAWTGAYAQARADWKMTEHLTSAVEAVHFAVGDTIRAAGGMDGDYLGVEGKYAW